MGIKINKLDKSTKLTLMSNFRDKLQQIDLTTYCDEFIHNWDEVSTLQLTIPSMINIDGRMIDNGDIYRAFKGKKQQLIMENPNIRFEVDEVSIKKQKFNGKFYNEKTIKCKSFDNTLSCDFVLGEDIVRQLYNYGANSLDVSDGILNIFEDRTGWKVKSVSENARKVFGSALIQRELPILANYTSSNVVLKQVIWEKDFAINPYDEHSIIGLNIVYSGLETTNSVGKVQTTLSPFSHNISGLYATVSHIKASYTKNNEGIYGITYDITYSDGNMIQKVVDEFVFCDGLNLKIDEIKLGYTNGETEEAMTIKYATFEQGTYKWLEFLRGNVAKAYDDLYFDFNTINKEVSVCLKSEYGKNHGGIIFSYDNFISEVNEVEQSDEIITKLYVNSQNTSIIDVNPLGTEFIYCFDYFIDNELMDDDLIAAWRRYETHVNNVAVEQFNLRVEANTINKEIISIDSELVSLDYTIGVLTRRRSSYQVDNKNGEYDTEIRQLSEQIIAKQTELETLLSRKATLQTELDKINLALKNIVTSIQIETAEDINGKIFTNNQIQDLNDLMITQTVEDNNYITSNGLYEYYKKDLVDRNKHHINFEIESEDFLQNINIPNGATWDYYLGIGNYVYTDDEDIIKDNDYKLRVVSYKVLFKDNDITDIKLNNRDRQVDAYSGGSISLKSDVGRASGYVNNFNSTWKNSTSVNQFVNSMLGEGLNASLVPLRNRSTRCKYDFTEAGLIIYDAFDENKQLMITSNVLCFTNDRFLTSKCALNDTGLTAKYVVGELLAGKELIITDDSGKGFYIGNLNSAMQPDKNGEDFGMQIRDMESTRERIFLGIRDGVATLRLYGDNGETVFTEEGILNHNQFNVYDNISPENGCEMTIPIKIPSGTKRIKECVLTLFPEQYRVWSRGAASGGSVNKTTSDGGSVTTSSTTTSNDSHRHIMFKSNENSEPLEGVDGCEYLCSATLWGGDGSSTVNGLYLPFIRRGVIPQYLYTYSQQTGHNHSVTINIGSHSHNMSIDSHTHNDVIGVRTINSLPTDMRVEVNGTIVKTGINLYGTEVDITSYIDLNITNNIVKIYSNTNGRLTVNVFEKRFINF